MEASVFSLYEASEKSDLKLTLQLCIKGCVHGMTSITKKYNIYLSSRKDSTFRILPIKAQRRMQSESATVHRPNRTTILFSEKTTVRVDDDNQKKMLSSHSQILSYCTCNDV